MLDLIGLIAGILEAWYLRRFFAALAAAAALFFGLPLLTNLPASHDFGGDLTKGLIYIAIATVLAIFAFRPKKSDS